MGSHKSVPGVKRTIEKETSFASMADPNAIHVERLLKKNPSMQSRLLAQMIVIGSVTSGMIYTLYHQSSPHWQGSLNTAKMSEHDEKHRIAWPKGAYESKPGPGIKYERSREHFLLRNI